MKWAINHRDEHIRADAPGVSYSIDLRCPVCRERVFRRQGRIREAHFAHYGGNFSKICEQYHPGAGVVAVAQIHASNPVHDHSKRAFGGAALLWRDEQSLPASLYLRLPSVHGGFESNVRVISRATSQFRGKSLTKPAFAGLRLMVPPGQCETTPHDPNLEALISEVLSKFMFTGNFFKVTSEGGQLEAPNAPLELGENYWLVTQTPLREPVSDLLNIQERRFDREWHAYRIGLPLLDGNASEGISELSTYLQRNVVRPRPRVNLVWPTPDRIDPDGIPVFDTSVTEILVRSIAGVPQCVVRDQLIDGEQVDTNLFAFRFDGNVEEAIIGVQSGPGRTLRFDACDLVHPAGVYIHVNDDCIQALDLRISPLLIAASTVRIEVPAHRLWRTVRVNGLPLRPLPDGTDYVIHGELRSFSAGSFGEVFAPPIVDGQLASRWFSSVKGIVAHMAGARAAERLTHVQNTGQLLRWACEHNAHALLPKLLSLISAGVARGVP